VFSAGVYYVVVDFWIFWIFNLLQLYLDSQKNSKTKIEKVFSFIFVSPYAEMSFLCAQNKEKVTK
jgi:hypothetical protein